MYSIHFATILSAEGAETLAVAVAVAAKWIAYDPIASWNFFRSILLEEKRCLPLMMYGNAGAGADRFFDLLQHF